MPSGVVGFRPSSGCYNGADGIVPMTTTRDTAGVIARSVTDVIMFDKIMSQKCRRSYPARVKVAGRRVGLPTDVWKLVGKEVGGYYCYDCEFHQTVHYISTLFMSSLQTCYFMSTMTVLLYKPLHATIPWACRTMGLSWYKWVFSTAWQVASNLAMPASTHVYRHAIYLFVCLILVVIIMTVHTVMPVVYCRHRKLLMLPCSP